MNGFGTCSVISFSNPCACVILFILHQIPNRNASSGSTGTLICLVLSDMITLKHVNIYILFLWYYFLVIAVNISPKRTKLDTLNRSHQILHGEIKLAELYENTMKQILGELDQVDQTALWCEVNEKVNKQSTAIMLALAEIEGYEGNHFRHGSIATLVEVKKILTEVVPSE